MRIRPGIIVLIVAVFGLLIGGRQLGWFGGKTVKPGETPGAPPEETTAPLVSPNPTTPAPAPAVPTTPATAGTKGQPGRTALAAPGTAATTTPDLIADWETRIDDVLTAKGDETQKAKQLLEILPKLPEEGQVEAAQHLSNLLPDEEYASLAPTLVNPQTPEAVLDVLMTDVLNRPNNQKLNTLLDVARTPNHPKAEEARDVLEVYVDENYGTDWTAWDAAVKKWLKDNPDE